MKKALLYLLIFTMTVMTLPALAQEVTLTLTFAGDCTLGGEDYLRNGPGSFDSYIKQYGTGYPFQYVRDIS